MASYSKFKFLSSKTFLFFALLVLVWLAIIIARATYNRYQFNQEIERLKSEIERTEKRNQELASLIEFFKTESFLEKEAREKLNLKKEGENVVVVPKMPEGREGSLEIGQENNLVDLEEKKEPEEESNIIKWWKYLFKE